MSRLFVIIPSVRNEQALPSIKSGLFQKGFDDVFVILAGKSAASDGLRNACAELSPKIYFDPSRAEKILPGTARNNGLKVASENGIREDDYVLFLDDDIVAPEGFAAELRSFLETFTDSAAVMGRVESRPANLWTRIIDYSNFWWLQVRHHVRDLGWLGAGATMISYGSVKDTCFREDMHVGEDTDFFMRIARREGKKLSIDALVTCEHFHGRESFSDFVSYQYKNGLLHTDWYSDGFSFKRFLNQFIGASTTAISENKGYLARRPHILLGVLMSFFICFFGTQVGSINNKRNKAGLH